MTLCDRKYIAVSRDMETHFPERVIPAALALGLVAAYGSTISKLETIGINP